MTPYLLPLAAVVAGMISFTSPCCLPLIPSYLSYVSALPVSELGRAEARSVTLRASAAFVGGFTVVFTALGAGAGLLGASLLRNMPLIVRVAGVLIIVMGLAMLGLLRLPFLHREVRIDLARLPRGPRGAFPLGMAYAAGWAPCIGPVLATVLATAAATETAAWGALLLALYSLGLGVPFILLALGFQRARGSMRWLARHGAAVERAGGVLLVGVGVLFVSGAWRSFFLPLQRYFAKYGWPPI
ncbi:MAG: sulfite exporter TauE/SafE family protein [Actinobacteria bacterium]|nr:sulfite exporter TauE/SafE family protein [Actinomycetota bacterium]